MQTPISSFFQATNTQEVPRNNSIVSKSSTTAKSALPIMIPSVPAHPKSRQNLEVAEPTAAFTTPNVPSSMPTTPTDVATSTSDTLQPIVVQANSLTALQQQASNCQQCALSTSRNQVVFGSGANKARLLFIADAPSRDEDVAGLPLVARSGDLFDRMLEAIDVKRDDVYMMNAVKCRPLHSRDPKPDEFAACEKWLLAQLDIIQPDLICLLGRIAAQTLLKTESSLTELRAQQHSYRGYPVLVIDHPAYLLRSQQHKRRAWQDLRRLQQHLTKLETDT